MLKINYFVFIIFLLIPFLTLADDSDTHWQLFLQALNENNQSHLQKEYEWLSNFDDKFVTLCQNKVKEHEIQQAQSYLEKANHLFQQKNYWQSYQFYKHLQDHFSSMIPQDEYIEKLNQCYLKIAIEYSINQQYEKSNVFLTHILSEFSTDVSNFYYGWNYHQLSQWNLSNQYLNKIQYPEFCLREYYFLKSFNYLNLTKLDSAKKNILKSSMNPNSPQLNSKFYISNSQIQKVNAILDLHYLNWQHAMKLMDQYKAYKTQSILSEKRLNQLDSHGFNKRFQSPRARVTRFKMVSYERKKEFLEQATLENKEKANFYFEEATQILNSIHESIQNYL